MAPITIYRLRGQAARKALDALDGSVALGLFAGRRLRGIATYYPATHGDPSCLVCGIAVNRQYRRHSLRLLGALKKVLIRQHQIIKGFFVLADSESSAGEKLCQVAAKRLPFPVVDLGMLDRIIEGKSVVEAGTWQELI